MKSKDLGKRLEFWSLQGIYNGSLELILEL